MTTQPVKRPFPVTLLAVLAGIAAFFAAIHALQSLRILPFFFGSFGLQAFSFWNFLMWALLVWVYVWLVRMLWNVDPQAWLFLAVITVFNLILDFMAIATTSTTFSDVSLSFLINAIILIYCMLPGTKHAFGVAK